MEWSVADEAIFRRTRNCTLERNWNEQPLSSSVFLTLLNVSPDFEQEVVFYFLSHCCMYSAVRPVFFRNFKFSSKLELLRTTTPPFFERTFVRSDSQYFSNGDKVKFEMTFHFGIFKSSFFFFPIARNVLNVQAQVSCFSRLCLWTDSSPVLP